MHCDSSDMKDAVCMTFIQLTQDVTVSFKLMVCSGHHVSLQVVIVAASVMNVHPSLMHQLYKIVYANNSHNGYQGDTMLTSQRCPTRKDASPSCIITDGSVCKLPITKTVSSNVWQVSKRCPARGKCICLMHQPREI